MEDLPTLNSKSKAITDLPPPACFLEEYDRCCDQKHHEGVISDIPANTAYITDLQNVQRIDAVTFLCHGRGAKLWIPILLRALNVMHT